MEVVIANLVNALNEQWASSLSSTCAGAAVALANGASRIIMVRSVEEALELFPLPFQSDEKYRHRGSE